ncbi:hypothetical protein ILUMI_17936 [Ignelater luminosus]|uniref:STAS domain-containing protein n=1 Tax=Ignelater luminosus TaxID=2038154 RepID=A0A8K0G4L8_IGNLU|nr:hypothetical protein ILUMI_17936 [Ignelater luminosus]
MHIPQGMAYGLLGNLPPVVGIYMAFFPVLIYVIFGTSRHVSMGTFAIVCLMTGKTVSQYSTEEFLPNGTMVQVNGDHDHHYTSMQVATTVTFAVAIFQMLMYIFRLGIITTLLSETLVNAFTCASAFHVVASQLKDLFGLTLTRRKGYFRVIYTLYDSAMAVPQANIAAVTVSAIFIIVMVINNEVLKPWLAKKTRIPFPIELVAVTVGTAISHCLNLHDQYGISIVGHIPTGFPTPDLPAFSLLPKVALDAFVITMVSYTITMSMALIFAQKLHYEVDANQELFALSWSNCFGSFFSCMPITASLSRSLIQQQVGGITQLASVVSCGILLVILLWIGPLFEELPRCVLASIIVVALKKMILQFTSLKTYWRLSKWDTLVWLVTFLTTVFIGIDVGLVAGILTSMLSIFAQGYLPYSCLLGVLPKTDLYLDLKRYKGTEEVPGIRIFHYSGSLNFASKSSYRFLLFKRVGIDPLAILTKRQEMQDRSSVALEFEDLLTKCIILDFAALTYIDPSGVEMLRQIIQNFNQLGIAVYITACSGPVFETLQRCDKYEKKDGKFIIFPTIHDAVLFAQAMILRDKIN